MTLNRIAFLLFVGSSILFPLFGADNIAVSDMIAQGMDQSSAIIISDRMRTELFKTGVFTVIERQAMQDILKEQGFQQSGACTDEQCLVQMGQLLGVARMVAGTIGKLGNLYTINVRMVDVATGKIVFSESVDCECPIEKVLTVSTPAIARKIAASVNPPAKPAQQPRPEAKPAQPVLPAAPAFGSMVIKSNPPAAQVTLDGLAIGLTPYSADSVKPGQHQVRLDLAGYDIVEMQVNISVGRTAEQFVTLKHSKAWKDSVEAAHKAVAAAKAVQQKPEGETGKPAKKHSVAPKVIFGISAVGSAVVGVLFNNIIKTKVDEDARIKAEYISLNDPTRQAEYDSYLTDNLNSASKAKLFRNICYSVSGACVAGFAISFAF